MIMVKPRFPVTAPSWHLTVWSYRNYPPFHFSYHLFHQMSAGYRVVFYHYTYQPVFEYSYRMIHIYLILITVPSTLSFLLHLSLCLPDATG